MRRFHGTDCLINCSCLKVGKRREELRQPFRCKRDCGLTKEEGLEPTRQYDLRNSHSSAHCPRDLAERIAMTFFKVTQSLSDFSYPTF